LLASCSALGATRGAAGRDARANSPQQRALWPNRGVAEPCPETIRLSPMESSLSGANLFR